MAIFSTLVSLFISILVILTPIFIIVGIVIFIFSHSEKDEVKKKKLKKLATMCCILPLIILFVVLSIWGLINVALGVKGA